MAKSNTPCTYNAILEIVSELFVRTPDACVATLPGTWANSANALPEHEYNEWLRMKHKGRGSPALERADHWTDSTWSTQSSDGALSVQSFNGALSSQSSDGSSQSSDGSSLLRTAMLLHRSAQQQEVETLSRPTSPLTQQFKPLTRNRGNWRSGKLAAMRYL